MICCLWTISLRNKVKKRGLIYQRLNEYIMYDQICRKIYCRSRDAEVVHMHIQNSVQNTPL